MDALLIKLVNMSITASWMVLAVLLLRLALHKAPRWISCLLWGAVGLRLVLPFSLESLTSLIPSTQTIQTTELIGRPFAVNVGVPVIDQSVNGYLGSHYYEGVTVQANTFERVLTVFGWIWLIGVVLMLVYSAVSYCRLYKTVAISLREGDNVYICDAVDSPFLLGVIRPRIYLPSGLCEPHKTYVIAHEKAHLRRRDHWWKPLGFALLTVYWFNPVLWIAYILFCRDIEAACDQKVIGTMDIAQKKGYSEALVACSIHRRKIMACPLAFGEVGVKARIRSVLHYKKPTVWILAASLLVCTVAAVCLLTDPPADRKEEPTPAPEASLADVVSYYDDLIMREDFIWYNSKSALCATIQCPASYELLDTLCLEQWQETSVDTEEYLAQRVFSHLLEVRDGYAFKLNIGEQYGGIEWYSDVIVETQDDGVTVSSDELQGVLCFTLPQEQAGEMLHRLQDLAWLYDIRRNLSVYTQNGDFEVLESTKQYHVLKESGGERYVFVPPDETLPRVYASRPTVSIKGEYWQIITAQGEHWYEPASGWYWTNDMEYSTDHLFDRQGSRVLLSGFDTVTVYDIAAQRILAEVWLTQAWGITDDYIHSAQFTGDFTAEVTYYADADGTLRTITFEVEDLSKRDPAADPPKTALKMPDKISLISEGWTKSTVVITQEDAHSLRIASTEYGVEVVTLSESNICRLNRLYAAVPVFSAVDGVDVSDGTQVIVEHDGVTERFSMGVAAYPEADYYIDQLCRLGRV